MRTQSPIIIVVHEYLREQRLLGVISTLPVVTICFENWRSLANLIMKMGFITSNNLIWSSQPIKQESLSGSRTPQNWVTEMVIPALRTNTFSHSIMVIFAQRRYHSRWGLSEAWLLLVENLYQYPELTTWNTVGMFNLWKPLRRLITPIKIIYPFTSP